jgi:hypothetical protein
VDGRLRDIAEIGADRALERSSAYKPWLRAPAFVDVRRQTPTRKAKSAE